MHKMGSLRITQGHRQGQGTLLTVESYTIIYLPTVILIVILIIIGRPIPSPTHSFTLGLNPPFSANPPYRTLSFFSHSGFTMISQTVYCYF